MIDLSGVDFREGFVDLLESVLLVMMERELESHLM